MRREVVQCAQVRQNFRSADGKLRNAPVRLLQGDIRQKSHCGATKVRRDSPNLVAAQPLTLRECQDAISSWQRIVATEHSHAMVYIECTVMHDCRVAGAFEWLGRCSVCRLSAFAISVHVGIECEGNRNLNHHSSAEFAVSVRTFSVVDERGTEI